MRKSCEPPRSRPSERRAGKRASGMAFRIVNRLPHGSRSRPELTEVRGGPILEELMRFGAHDVLLPHRSRLRGVLWRGV